MQPIPPGLLTQNFQTDIEIESLGCHITFRRVISEEVKNIIDNKEDFVEMIDLLIEMGKNPLMADSTIFSIFYNGMPPGEINNNTETILNIVGSCSPVRELINEFIAYDYASIFQRVARLEFQVDDQIARLEMGERTLGKKRYTRVFLIVFNKLLVPQHFIDFIIDKQESHGPW